MVKPADAKVGEIGPAPNRQADGMMTGGLVLDPVAPPRRLWLPELAGAASPGLFASAVKLDAGSAQVSAQPGDGRIASWGNRGSSRMTVVGASCCCWLLCVPRGAKTVAAVYFKPTSNQLTVARSDMPMTKVAFRPRTTSAILRECTDRLSDACQVDPTCRDISNS
jgi:hypothetical protein